MGNSRRTALLDLVNTAAGSNSAFGEYADLYLEDYAKAAARYGITEPNDSTAFVTYAVRSVGVSRHMVPDLFDTRDLETKLGRSKHVICHHDIYNIVAGDIVQVRSTVEIVVSDAGDRIFVATGFDGHVQVSGFVRPTEFIRLIVSPDYDAVYSDDVKLSSVIQRTQIAEFQHWLNVETTGTVDADTRAQALKIWRSSASRISKCAVGTGSAFNDTDVNAANWCNLGLGRRVNASTVLHGMLRAHGYATNNLDGPIDDSTLAAMNAFRKAKKLPKLDTADGALFELLMNH